MTRRTRLYFLASFKICTLLWRGGIHAKRSASLSATLDQNDGPIEIFAIVLKPHWNLKEYIFVRFLFFTFQLRYILKNEILVGGDFSIYRENHYVL